MERQTEQHTEYIERERGWVGGRMLARRRLRRRQIEALLSRYDGGPTPVRYGVQMLRTVRALNPGLRLDVTSVEIFNAYPGMLCRTSVGSEKPRK